MSYGMYLGRNRTHFKGVLKVQKDSRSWKIISWHCHDWGKTWLPRTQYFKIMTEQTKKEAQQNPCSADDINSLGHLLSWEVRAQTAASVSPERRDS